MIKLLVGLTLGTTISVVSTCADAQTRRRGATTSTSSDVGRRLDRDSLLPSPEDGSPPVWPLGRINGKLGQRIDSRLNLRLSGRAPVQRNTQSQAILQQAQPVLTSDLQ